MGQSMTDLTLANGNVRLAASVDGPMDAVPILLLHGASVSRDTWDETKQRLMDRYCVWTLIFRGHGHWHAWPVCSARSIRMSCEAHNRRIERCVRPVAFFGGGARYFRV